MTQPALATTNINLRASHEQKALIDRAASCLGKSRTEFILDTTREAAEQVLLDRRLYLLDKELQVQIPPCAATAKQSNYGISHWKLQL